MQMPWSKNTGLGSLTPPPRSPVLPPSLKEREPQVEKSHTQRSGCWGVAMKVERSKITPRQTQWDPTQMFPSLGKQI